MRTPSNRDNITRALEARGITLKGVSCQCPDPQHDDAHPSAGIFEGTDGQWRVKCQSCGKRWDYDDLMGRPDGNGEKPATPTMTKPEVMAALKRLGTVESVDRYTDAEGKVVLLDARVKTVDGKTFRPFHPVGARYRWGECFKPWPLLNQMEIKEAGTLVVCEGSKAVRALSELGIVATTAPFGAPAVTPAGVVAESKAKHSDWTPLRGKRVILWPDNDAAGVRHMDDIAEILAGLDCEVAILAVGHLEPKADAADLPPDARIQMVDAATFITTATTFGERNQLIFDGVLKPCPTPWPRFSESVQAFMPGTMTLLYGAGGVRKTYFLIHLIRHLMANGVRPAYLALEMEEINYVDRALAQEACLPGMVSLIWKSDPANRGTIEAVKEKYTDFMNAFGKTLHFPPGEMVTCNAAIEWVESLPDDVQVVMIDPISLLISNRPIFDAHKELAYRLTRLAQRTRKSIVISNHTTKDGQFMGGGASLKDHTDSTYCFKANSEGKAICRGKSGFKEDVAVHNKIEIVKGRFAEICYVDFGFEFMSHNLTFEERGIVVE